MRAAPIGVLIAILSSSCDAPPPAAPALAQPTVSSAVGASDSRSGGGALPTSLDIDGDGKVSSQTDAILIQRFIAGFQGESLIEGAVGPGCQRCTAEQIAAYIGSL